LSHFQHERVTSAWRYRAGELDAGKAIANKKLFSSRFC